MLFIILLGLVIMVRIWMIAQAPSAFGIDPGDVHPDQGTVLLMAKHILDGGEFPIFQYDTAMLGSLEAFLLSSCYLLFGINLWVIHIVPVLCFIFFCLALFLLAKDLFGSQVGLWSLLWCVFSTITISENSIMPQLGNISAPMFGTALLCITIKIINSSNLFTKRWGYGLLGLLGGIGWWTSPMMIYYLVTIPIFILLKERGLEILRGGFWGTLLFFVGASPFFCYYAVDPQIDVLIMGVGYSLKNLKEGLPLFFLDRIHYFLDLDKFGSLHQLYFWVGAFIYLGATIFLFWGHRQDLTYLLKPRYWSKISPGFILGILFLVFLGILSSSVHIERNATRYFLPLASFFPIAIGYGVVGFRKHWRMIPIFLGLLLFFIQMEVSWNFVKVEAPSAEAATRMVIGLTNELSRKGIRHIYSWQSPGSELINFYSKERIISSRPMLERYRPYEDILESSDRVAFLDPGDNPVLPTLGVIGGSCLQEKMGPFQLYRGFKPHLREYREIPKEEVRLEVSDQQQNVPKMIDRNLDTEWSSGRPKSPDMWLKIDLGKIHSLGMIRLFNHGSQHAHYAYHIEMEASLDGLSWKKIIPDTQMNLYYWDGPRIYCWELNYRWECRFGPLKARFLLIRNKEQSDRYPWKIGELYVFDDQGELTTDSFDYKSIVERIQGLGLQKIYAGRWLSAKIRETTKGGIQTVQTFTEASFARRWPRSRVIEFGPRTGFIVDRQDQSGFEEMLNQAGIKLAWEPFGRWNLYYFKEWGLKQKYLENHRGFWWTGFGILRVGPAVWDEFHRRGLDHWKG
ncbi:MAG: discoidin domain-containing protein [Thermodesulfobacteriota bacterium]